MKFIYTFLIAFVAKTTLYAQSDKQFSRSIFTKEISFIKVDTTYGSQSTVIEYPKFLVVIEVPMFDDGANRSTNLIQDIPKAEKFLAYLKNQYNDKPIKYVLSSHWHLHSLSGITPFFNQGATLVVAKSNWEYSVKNGLFGKVDTKAFEKQVIQVTKDITILDNTAFPISVLFLDETYTNKPTKDYLFFYMPTNKCIHASCMCAIPEIDFQKRPEFIYNDRVTDLEKAIKSRNLEVTDLIKLAAEFDKEMKVYKMPALKNTYYEEFKQRGKPMAEIVKGFSSYELNFLQSSKDSILHSLVTKKISAEVLNSTVYACIKNKDFLKAVQWAQILNLYSAGDYDYLDTMGEAYYNAGDILMAQHISNQLTALSGTKFPNQFKEWEQAKQNSH